MAPSNYEGKALNLKKNVHFVCVREGGSIPGKLFYLGTLVKHARTAGTATMLLYLLARDEGDDIRFNTVASYVFKKFSFDTYDQAVAAVNAFLDFLENHCFPEARIPHFNRKTGELTEVPRNVGILDVHPAGNAPDTPDPDPLGLFDGDKIAWEDPIEGFTANQRHLKRHQTHFYSLPEGGNGVTIRR
jgi:hypothetical protein